MKNSKTNTKDVYFLTYVRDDVECLNKEDLKGLVPEFVKKKVDNFDEEYIKKCEEYKSLIQIREQFKQERQNTVEEMSNLISQHITNEENPQNCMIVDKEVLQRYANGEPDTSNSEWEVNLMRMANISPAMEEVSCSSASNTEESSTKNTENSQTETNSSAEDGIDKIMEIEADPPNDIEIKSSMMQNHDTKCKNIAEAASEKSIQEEKIMEEEEMEKENEGSNVVEKMEEEEGGKEAMESEVNEKEGEEEDEKMEEVELEEEEDSEIQIDENIHSRTTEEKNTKPTFPKMEPREKLMRIYRSYNGNLCTNIECEHGNLDPNKVSSMKRIPMNAYRLMYADLVENDDEQNFQENGEESGAEKETNFEKLKLGKQMSDVCRICFNQNEEKNQELSKWMQESILLQEQYDQRGLTLDEFEEKDEAVKSNFQVFMKKHVNGFFSKRRPDKIDALRRNAAKIKFNEEILDPNQELFCDEHARLKPMSKRSLVYYPKEFGEKLKQFFPQIQLVNGDRSFCEECVESKQNNQKMNSELNQTRKLIKEHLPSLFGGKSYKLKEFPDLKINPTQKKLSNLQAEEFWYLVPYKWAKEVEQFVKKELEGQVQESLAIKNFKCPHDGVTYQPYPYGICAEGFMPPELFCKITEEEYQFLYENYKNLFPFSTTKMNTLPRMKIVRAEKQEKRQAADAFEFVGDEIEMSKEINKYWDRVTITFESDYCQECGPEKNQQFALEKKQFRNLTLNLQKLDKLLPLDNEVAGRRPRRSTRSGRSRKIKRISGMNYDHTVKDLLVELFQADSSAIPGQVLFYKGMYESANSLELSQTLDEIGISEDDKTIFFMVDDSLLEDYSLITGTDVMLGGSNEEGVGFANSFLASGVPVDWICST